ANSSSNINLETRSGIFFDPDQFPKAPPSTAAIGPDGVIPKSRAFTGGTRDLPAHHAARLEPNQNQTPETSKGSSSMAIHPKTRICSHIKVNGVRCGSPALREEVFCYFHQRMIRGVRTPPRSRIHPMAMLEDRESIQASLMEVINALVRNQIDYKRAALVLRALHIATRNSNKLNFHWNRDRMVDEVPEYPAVLEPKAPDNALQQAGVLSQINRPKPRYPSDYGITVEQALAWRDPPEMMEPPRDPAIGSANVARFIENWMKLSGDVAEADANRASGECRGELPETASRIIATDAAVHDEAYG
ncbi:MAG: hypothetical protein WCF22_14150, partial [Candidatus Sulfotelmatobacter sp.]